VQKKTRKKAQIVNWKGKEQEITSCILTSLQVLRYASKAPMSGSKVLVQGIAGHLFDRRLLVPPLKLQDDV